MGAAGTTIKEIFDCPALMSMDEVEVVKFLFEDWNRRLKRTQDKKKFSSNKGKKG